MYHTVRKYAIEKLNIHKITPKKSSWYWMWDRWVIKRL